MTTLNPFNMTILQLHGGKPTMEERWMTQFYTDLSSLIRCGVTLYGILYNKFVRGVNFKNFFLGGWGWEILEDLGGKI